jgi:hypothetical protein
MRESGARRTPVEVRDGQPRGWERIRETRRRTVNDLKGGAAGGRHGGVGSRVEGEKGKVEWRVGGGKRGEEGRESRRAAERAT